jgi:hypothetical protein
MARGSLAPLNANEETTLRRVALGVSKAASLSKPDVERLRALALVEDRDGDLRLTATGRERYLALPRTVPIDRSDVSEDPVSRLARFMTEERG